MANPPPYNLSYSFSGWQASNPSKPLPAGPVDNEYSNISLSLNQTIAALADVRRSDGKLKNGIVTVDALAPGLTLGFTLKGAWTLGAHYVLGDGVFYAGKCYRCQVVHDATNANRPDVDTTTWMFLYNTTDLAGAMSIATYDPTGVGANVYARANHTGTQAISTIVGLQTALDAKLPAVGVPGLNGGPLGGFRNKIINGDFPISQRALSQTSSGYGSVDRWDNSHSGTTKTTSYQTFTVGQTDVPGSPIAFCRTVVSTVAGVGNYCSQTQRIENVRTLEGKTATVTLYAKADASKNIAVELVQNFGTGGSPSATVDSIGSRKLALTTTWTKFTFTVAIPSIAGKTLGSNNNHSLNLRIWFDAGTNFNTQSDILGQQSGTFDIAHVSIVEGDATAEIDPFSPRHLQQELALCQRYYQRLTSLWIQGYNTTGLNIAQTLMRPVPMRIAPANVLSNSGSNSNISAINVIGNSAHFAHIGATISGTGNGNLSYDMTSDAEL